MKKRIIILSALIIFVLFAGGLIFYLGYSGFFYRPSIENKKTGEMVLVVQDFKGDYAKTGAIQDKIYYFLKDELQIETYKGAGIYYSDPKKTPKEECFSTVGCILEPSDYDRTSDIPEKYKILKINDSKAYISEFPYRNKMSIMAGIFKVYPTFAKYMKENNIPEAPFMEIYNVQEKKILYILRTE